MPSPHANRQLFSDYYLDRLLSARPEWQALADEANAVRQSIAAILARFVPAANRDAIASLATAITAESRARYEGHVRARRRVVQDLGAPDLSLGQKLTAFWGLEFPVFRAEVQRVFRRDVPLKERDAWDEWLAGARADHERRTTEIVRLETELNARVYALFDLSAEEVRLVEAATKYRYGEV